MFYSFIIHKSFWASISSSIILVVGLFLFPLNIHAAVTPDDPNNFITTWNTENPGTSNDDQITIPHANGSTYNYELYWVNTASSSMSGTTTVSGTGAASSPTLTFPEPGIYEVQASGTFPRIYRSSQKLITIEQWGDMVWTSMEEAFRNNDNLAINAVDAPDLSSVTSMSNMFRESDNFNSDISHWDVSNVSDFSVMFFNATNYNQPLNDWNMSNASATQGMFWNSAFNQPLPDWDVSNVTNMLRMFQETPFNQNISSWDVGNVRDMSAMFDKSAFNQSLNDWDVSSVQNFSAMFFENTVFNQPLNNWVTASATDMARMFLQAESFNQDICDWDVSGVTEFWQMFLGAISFNQPLNCWDTSSATEMRQMFWKASNFNQPLDNWDTANVQFMANMFRDATAFDQDLSSWTIESVIPDANPQLSGMNDMFLNAGLSTTNLDATLTSFATQAASSTIENIPFHLGLKTYSQTGADAIDTLKGLGWTITEQYQAEYRPSSDATLYGTSVQAPLNSGATTTAVEIDPDRNCTFQEWSDGNTDNPRQDVLTDNLSVTAELSCRTYGTSARTQREKQAEFNTLDDSDTTAESLQDTLDKVKELNEKPLPPLDPVRDRETITELIKVLLELVEALTQLLTMRVEGA